MKKRYIAIIVMIIMLCGIFNVVKADNLSDLQAQKEQIIQDLNNANEGLENIEIELTDTLEAVNRLEAQIMDGQTKLEETEEQIKSLESDIKVIQGKLEYIQKDYNTQKDTLEKRLVALYEMGETTYLDVLLNSKSISDFISNYYLIAEIAQYDSDLLDTIEREKNKIEEIEKQITQRNENLKLMQENQEKTLIALENAKTIKNSYINSLTDEEKNTQNLIEEYNKKLDNVEAQMLILAMGDGNLEFVGGEFLWPAPGYTTITSPFGMRFHPILHYYRMHNGIDIGVPLGSSVVAANDGVVTTSAYISSYGNVVMIDHGGGVKTAYAHGSELIAKVGQTVSRGEVIMKSGTTGLSTGPHLHFEISINGKFVDPIPFVTGTNNN